MTYEERLKEELQLEVKKDRAEEEKVEASPVDHAFVVLFLQTTVVRYSCTIEQCIIMFVSISGWCRCSKHNISGVFCGQCKLPA